MLSVATGLRFLTNQIDVLALILEYICFLLLKEPAEVANLLKATNFLFVLRRV